MGVALLASKEKNISNIEFELNDYTTSAIVCTGCERNCQLTKYSSDKNDDSFVVGGKCGKY